MVHLSLNLLKIQAQSYGV